MPVLGKRKRVSRARAVKTAMRVGNWASVARASRRTRVTVAPRTFMQMSRSVRRLNSMIETKENCRSVVSGILASQKIYVGHNNTNRLNINPFLFSGIGAGDPMQTNIGNRIGDKISVKGLMIKGFLENAFARSKVYWRIMFIRSAKGDTPNRDNMFKNASGNKMIDQINVERFTVIKQKIFNITPAEATAAGTVIAPLPGAGEVFGGTVAGIATRTFKMWIPGRKFGRNGTVTFENESQGQVKFYDYHILILCYDWSNTPQDVNNIGVVNEVYTKLYFKDA